ncbi:2-(3-amino-3-carboxypropyl)histidine synthase subunit 2 [Caerostris extrusa]|uniref:2-(3-amino-3-carboxypropyl)histidine synthase subunit 2 n=1 Tax=Caerostris extrusa TaxID=172846 RepID=A0AAV4X8V2_CAEEX|nr:2-(3-amino-3-carboxypropyl)histidine synthase subunit 2 [Caerostris extrusa]
MYQIAHLIPLWFRVDTVEKCLLHLAVALQFPDSLLGDAVVVTQILEDISGKQIFVLGDTSFGSCCVDEIAAEHASAEAIVHFGHSCLSPTNRLPVLYIFGKQMIDTQDAVNAFENMFPDKMSEVILLYEVMYFYDIDSIIKKLKGYKNLIVSCLEIPGEDETCFNILEAKKNFICITKYHRHLLIPSGKTLDNHKVFYIGTRSVTLTNFMLSLKNCTFYSYNPVTKHAQAETLDLIKQAGKKSYTLVVGKLNNAKLANFAEIEVFVNVACVESSLIESRDFYQSIVTPYELEIALNQARAVNYVPPIQNAEIENDVSLVSGKIRHVGLSSSNEAENDSTNSLITRNEMTLSAVHSKASGEFLTQRSWQGLEQHLGETPVAEITQGQEA